MWALVAGFIAKPYAKYLLGALAVAAVVAGVVLYLDHVRSDGKKAGAAEVRTEVQQNTITLQREIKRAEDTAPRTPHDVSKRLRDGTF